MDKQEHKGARLIADDLISVTPSMLPGIQICFPPELGLKNRNVWGEVIDDKYHIMTVKEWLKNKKSFFTIQESPVVVGEAEFTPRKAIASRYGKTEVNPGFYGVIKIEGKSED